jgi:hypothetical protein
MLDEKPKMFYNNYIRYKRRKIMKLITMSNLLSKIETELNIDINDFDFIMNLCTTDSDEFIGALVVLEQNIVVFTDAPYSSAAEVLNIDLEEEGKGITWFYFTLD